MSVRQRDLDGFEIPAKTFFKKVDFADDNADFKTEAGVTNDESVFHGSFSRARQDSRSLADFSSGIGYFYAKRNEKDHLVLIPLIGWLCYFGEDPKGVADHLEDKAKEVVRRWKVLNEPIKDGTRKPIGWVEDVHKHEWRAQRGKKETSIYEISLNSYFYTTNNQWTKEPDITTRDLKLLIKVRSSVLFDNRPDKSSTDSDGLSLDNKGYNQNLHHFLGLLRSPEFAGLVEAVKTEFASLNKAEAAAEKEEESVVAGSQSGELEDPGF